VEQFVEIITKPDNIPISLMAVVVIFFTLLSLWQALRNDRLIKEGKRDEIIKQMRQ
jgi:hypothetical protein